MANDHKARNSTANNALAILNLFSVDQPRITAIGISNYLGTSRSTAYRYLDTLLDMGFLAADPAGGYRIGRRIQELAMVDQASDRALSLAKDWLVRLRDEFDETVNYVVRAGLRTVIRATEPSRRLLKVTYELGMVMPLHAGASSLVLLCGSSDEQIRDAYEGGLLEKYTDTTPTTVAQLQKVASLVREQGYYVSRGEYDPDAVSVGVPIFGDDRGKPLAGLGFVVPTSRMSSSLEAAMAHRLKEVAQAIHDALVR